MASPLAQTTFASGPKDSLIALDVYGANGAAVVNSIQALSAKAGIDFAGLFGSKLPSNVSGVLNAAAGAVGINKDALTKRLVQASATVANAFKSLSTGAQGAILDAYSDSGVITTTVGSIKSSVSSANFSDVSGLSTFLNQYTTSMAQTGSSPYSVQDEDGMACVMAGVIGEGSSLGVNGVYSQLTSGITTPTLISKVVDQSVPTLIANSDIDTLHDMSTSAGSVIGALFPNFCSNLVRGYTSTLAGFERNPAQAFNNLVSTLNNVKTTWNQFIRNPTDTAMSMLSLAGASQDLLNVVAIGTALLDPSDPNKYMALAAHYPQTTVEAAVRKFFPATILTTNLRRDPKALVISPAVNNLLGVVISGVAQGLRQ